MKLTFSLAAVLMLFSFMPASSQQVTLEMKDVTLREVFRTLKQQTGVIFVYPENEIDRTSRVSVAVDGLSLEQTLDRVLSGLPYSYEWVNDMIVIKSTRSESQPPQRTTVTGIVRDQQGHELPGVTVRDKDDMRSATATDSEGRFTLSVAPGGRTLVFSFVGKKSVEIVLDGRSELEVVLPDDTADIGEVVVTGIFQRNKESFTGSSTTFSNADLKIVGNQNVLQSLRTLDPSIAFIENDQFGSDPNRLPDIEIRGKSSVIGLSEQYGTDPNQPLFILDGFETTLATISDLSMDRVESITILKDAAATAIYGSKAANGVVVVETVRPAAGQLRVQYNFDLSLSWADLSDYNLMNSMEKLTFERLSGYYGTIDAAGNIVNEKDDKGYMERFKEVRRGVDTYWMNEPLRFATSHRHSLFIDGGDENLRYGVTLNYGDTQGVMKGSDRNIVGGNVKLLYRKGKLSFSNSLSIDYTKADRESVPFADFSRANPYHKKFNEDGSIDKVLESQRYLDLSTFSWKDLYIYNPLYDMRNNNVNETGTFGFTNNFEIEWRILPELRARGRLSIGRTVEDVTVFRSPNNSEFAEAAMEKKGTYTESNSRAMRYDGDVSLTYGKLFGEAHMVNAVGGFTFNQQDSRMSGYSVQGFVDDDFSNPTFAFGYPEDKKSSFNESRRRSASFYLNAGYAYDTRYLVDANFRSDGSSVYGVNSHFTTTWSVGVAWNIHNEAFFKSSGAVNTLKLRASVGNPGNQNFTDYISSRIYAYNNEITNPFGTSVIVSDVGNENLKWQKTLDFNVGLDLVMFRDRLRLNVDVFNKKTDPLLVFIGTPSSIGTTSVPRNLGQQITKGITGTAQYFIVKRDNMLWSVNVNARHLKSEYRKIDQALDKYNRNNQSRNLIRYYNGASPSDLWAVRSLGIDPITGREIYLNKNGAQTFLHNYDNEVVVGNSEPSVEGVFGTFFYYKGFSASINLRYRLGGQIFMQTLYQKVENITTDNLLLNQDRRALTDRWKNPGDKAKFRSISNSSNTPISSRFVEDNNVLSGESISVGYEGTARWMKSVGISAMTARIYMNDIFRISTVKNERGIDYPFARSVSMSLGIRF